MKHIINKFKHRNVVVVKCHLLFELSTVNAWVLSFECPYYNLLIAWFLKLACSTVK